MLPGHRAEPAASPPPGPVESLSNEETMKQLVDPAREIVKVAGLQEVSGGFGFEACNDQGEPPYRGRLEMGFRIPPDIEPKKYFRQIAMTVVQQGVGWSDGPPPGKKPFGTVIHTDTVMAIINQNPVAREDGYVHLFGECRNMEEHSGGGGVDVTGQLLS